MHYYPIADVSLYQTQHCSLADLGEFVMLGRRGTQKRSLCSQRVSCSRFCRFSQFDYSMHALSGFLSLHLSIKFIKFIYLFVKFTYFIKFIYFVKFIYFAYNSDNSVHTAMQMH